GGVVVDDRPVEPFPAVHPKAVPGLDRGRRWNLRVPTVVAHLLLVLELARRVEREDHFGHGSSSLSGWTDTATITAAAAFGAKGSSSPASAGGRRRAGPRRSAAHRPRPSSARPHCDTDCVPRQCPER